MMILSLFSYVIPVRAQCYGCGQNSTALKQALLEKHEQNTTNLTQNVIITQNGNKITPLQTQENGSNLSIHYERGIDVTGKVMPTGPPPQLDNSSIFPTVIVVGGIIGTAVIGISVLVMRKRNENSLNN